MDKLRAIKYFHRAVECGSFAAAARSLDVSAPAVIQLVSALERLLNVPLLHRTSRGLSPTADGERYYEASRKIAAELYDLEQRLGVRGAKPRGTLVVGIGQALGSNCLMPRIARFLARFPDIELVAKPVATIDDINVQQVDLAILVGWPPQRELAVRTLAQTRLTVCASPAYWRRAGQPVEPDDLSNHPCIIFRSIDGVLLDRWTFERDGERRIIDVKGPLICHDRHWLEDAASAGAGVIRIADLTVAPYLASGRLAPILLDWKVSEAPTIFAAYPLRHRHSKLVRAFLDFLSEIFSELESERIPALAGAVPREPTPEWFGRAHGRHSTYASKKRPSHR